jgi:hypothetical protein
MSGCSDVPSDVILADASRLLSAIFFVNVWPLEADPTITYSMPSSWLYLNLRATHRLTSGHSTGSEFSLLCLSFELA